MSNRQMSLMAAARSRISFNPRHLTFVLYGGRQAVERREAVLDRVEDALDETDSMKLPQSYVDLDRTAAYHYGLKWGKVLFQEDLYHQDGIFDFNNHHHALVNASPYGLHSGMFIPTLKLQASAEQLRYWLPLAESGKIIGTYCQTELGHGSFVRGLETTATFDVDADEFVIHSPTLSSTKYWPGGLGLTSTHALVMARLIIFTKDFGVHPFIVQVRSLEDHSPLPGLELGDVGPKMGLNHTDNGYAVFTHVRIPRQHMLMGNAQVHRDGRYVKASHDKLSYSTMIYVRNRMTRSVGFQLAQAATIAVRYSTVREQGQPDDNRDGEVTIMAYRSQHYRLLSILSSCFALAFSSEYCATIYNDLISRQQKGDHSSLAYAHATTAGFKAFATQTAADGVEVCRKCTGGHGFSALSGLPELASLIIPAATFEGENTVMYGQAARYLIKCAVGVRAGKRVDPEMSYLAEGYRSYSSTKSKPCPAKGEEFLSAETQLAAFRHRAVRLIFDAEDALRQSQIKDRMSPSEAWNTHMMAAIQATRAHIELVVVRSFLSKLPTISDPHVRRVLTDQASLFALIQIESPDAGGSIHFFEDGYISRSQLADIRKCVDVLLRRGVPEAIGLVDAWNFSDASLQSALGRKDGNVYEALMSWTRQLPINQQAAKAGGVDRTGYEEYIKPILRARL